MQRLSWLNFQGTLLFHLYLPLGNEFLAAFAIDEPKKTFWCVVVRLTAIFSLLGSRRGLFVETMVKNLSCHDTDSSAALEAFRDLCRGLILGVPRDFIFGLLCVILRKSSPIRVGSGNFGGLFILGNPQTSSARG